MRTVALATGLAVGLLLAGCTNDGSSAAAQAADAEDATDGAEEQTDRSMDLVGSMALEPNRGPAGTEVSVTGEDLPADETLEVWWSTVDCDWVLAGEANEEYHGRECTERLDPLAEVETDTTGAFEASFTVPEDYGFSHDVVVTDPSDTIRNQALFTQSMEVSVSPESGPVGTPITIEVKGMGWQTMEDTRTVLYDNNYVGFMSAVTTRGTATAVIPATGAPGPHLIEINRGAYTFPYLNPEQSPRPDIPTFAAEFTVTEGVPDLPAPVDEQNPAPIERDDLELPGDEAAIVTDLVSGPVGTPLTIRGAGFEPETTVVLEWFRIVGNRVSGQGWEERAISLGEVVADDDGTIELSTELPGDVGGPHRIEANVDGESMAETSAVITPHAEPLPGRVQWGDELQLELTGVGWTETANIYTLVYDNDYVGYACGFNTQGHVELPLTATGEPGWHFVDLYPAIYKGEETPGRNNFRIPQLTYADDHPGEELPAFRFAFYIER